MQPVERKKTIAELYTELDNANLMRRRSKDMYTEPFIHWRNEVGRLSQEIRRAQMLVGNNKGEN